MSRHQGHRPGRRAHFRPAHVLGLFVFYAALAFAVLAFTFFFIYTRLEFGLVIVLTIAVGAIATAVHVRAGRRSRIDSLVDKGL